MKTTTNKPVISDKAAMAGAFADLVKLCEPSVEEQKEEFQRKVRHAILDGLDREFYRWAVTEKGRTHQVGDGWKDQDLAVLFKAADAHAEVLWARGKR